MSRGTHVRRIASAGRIGASERRQVASSYARLTAVGERGHEGRFDRPRRASHAGRNMAAFSVGSQTLAPDRRGR
jgi:hypothetical protein